ncbi:GNAT family N-acetyltransferase [Breoghania sp. JC706]|uniref:GNAT family N-acetyltransferase n=1 Tax=Breoghania sp. JC706 TaxID=3117732 RepID=UPI00300BC13C
MSDKDFTLEETETRGRVVYREPGMGEAESTFSKAGANLLIIDHTEVPEDYRGQGVALQLVTRLIEHARATGRKITPLCPYAAAQFARHPDWNDVLAS